MRFSFRLKHCHKIFFAFFQDTRIKLKLRQRQDVIEQDTNEAQQRILEQLKHEGSSQGSLQTVLDEETDICRREREKRVAKFLQYLDSKRNAYIREAKLSNLI